MNPYKELELDENASSAEVQAAYMRLKTFYGEQRFTAGAVGAEAVKKLDRIEAAYKEILSQQNLRQYTRTTSAGNDFTSETNNASQEEKIDNEAICKAIEDKIRAGELDEAQKMLDDVAARTAEWHYLQSIIYFKKNWYLESKKQLEFAMKLDPNNPKYGNAMDKLSKVMSKKQADPESFTSRDSSTNQGFNPRDNVASNGTCTGSCCGDFCVANMCCNCAQACCCR